MDIDLSFTVLPAQAGIQAVHHLFDVQGSKTYVLDSRPTPSRGQALRGKDGNQGGRA